MDLQSIRHHVCSLDHGEGIILVDVEFETQPRTDDRGNRLYYRLTGHHIFSVKAQGRAVPHKKPRTPNLVPPTPK